MTERLHQEVFQALKDKKMLLATAESMTGGKIAESIISQSGASKVFDSSFVVYSESMKREVLGVVAENIYSKECVTEMCYGVKKLRPQVNLIVTTSGFAENPEDSSERFGTHVGILINDTMYTAFLDCEKMVLSRNDMREHVKNRVLFIVRDLLYDHH